jgi:hypothetical protein
MAEEIEQLEVKEVPKECPVLPPCPVCPPKPKPWQICLRVFLLSVAGLALAFIILACSGLRITRKESLLDVWLASRKGITPTPEIFEPTLTPLVKKDPITVEAGLLGLPVESPLVINGTVEAGWMFEGVFPVKLLDANRKEIARATAKEVTPGSWQSGQPVEFSATLTFTTQSTSGFLVFENDNPSGLPENSKKYEVQVRFD